MTGTDATPPEGVSHRVSHNKAPAANKQHMDSATLDNVKLQEPSAETYAAIMAQHKPDPWGPGYIRLYMVAGSVFLCSTMSGM